MSTARRDLEAGLSLALNGGFCNGPRAEKGNFLILDDANDMTIATVHKDGNPQANTVSYVNDGLNIYFGSAANSQKARNLARDSKVSLTTNLPYTSWNDIRGLSIVGLAERVTDPQEIAQISRPMLDRFPQIAPCAPAQPEDIVLFRITPRSHFNSRLPQGLWPQRSRQTTVLKRPDVAAHLTAFRCPSSRTRKASALPPN